MIASSTWNLHLNLRTEEQCLEYIKKRLPSNFKTLGMQKSGSSWIYHVSGVTKIEADSFEECLGKAICQGTDIRSRWTIKGPFIDGLLWGRQHFKCTVDRLDDSDHPLLMIQYTIHLDWMPQKSR